MATGFGSGFSPVAPGTAGALLAVLLWVAGYFLLPFAQLQVLLAVLVVYFTVQGVYSSGVMEKHWGEDPSRIVVDEMVGVWIPLLAASGDNLWYALAAFVLFRFFDILKPLGIRRMEALPGGIGVMMDDILSGIYSLILIIGTQWLIS